MALQSPDVFARGGQIFARGVKQDTHRLMFAKAGTVLANRSGGVRGSNEFVGLCGK